MTISKAKQYCHDDSNVRLPDLPPPSYNTTLNRIVTTYIEIKSALQTLKTSKASGPKWPF